MSDIKTLPIGPLQIPPYQRPEQAHHIKRLAKVFDLNKVGVLVVSERGGLQWVVDGQQRRAVLLEQFGPEYQTPCEVHTGLQLDQEAELFNALNLNRLRVSQLDMFHGRLRMGALRETVIQQMAEAHGLGVGKGHNQISAAGLIVDMYEADPARLDLALGVAVGAYGVREGTGAAKLLRGLDYLLRERPQLDPARLTTVMAKAGTVYTLMGQARGVGGGSGGKGMAAAMLELYNHGLRTNRLDPL